MLRLCLPILSLIALCISGCSSRVITGHTSAPVTPEQLPQIRTEYQKVNPMVRVGLVTDVLVESKLVSVDYARIGDFAQGDAICIVDPKDQILANGYITEVVGQKSTVKYVPISGARAPEVGDLVLHFQ